ncbi:phosphoribosylformylglycinamidine synthase [Spatholobus suberectus]|nr:phosphoribosylformylglycinamidine synthase [Spatholobus suberectus]
MVSGRMMQMLISMLYNVGMAPKLYCLVCACIEILDKNPIISICDQGVGGHCNVVKEIIDPKGAKIDVRAIVVGDQTMSVLQIWGAEYQEQVANCWPLTDSLSDVAVTPQTCADVTGSVYATRKQSIKGLAKAMARFAIG